MRNWFVTLIFLIQIMPVSVLAECHVNTNMFGEPFFKLKEMIFKKVILSDCEEVAKLSHEQKLNKPDCSDLVNKMLDFFDCHSTYMSGPVCFRTELEQILNSEEGQKYLAELNRAFNNFHFSKKNDKEKFKVWNWTIQYFKNDQNKAVKYLAILFQDYSNDISKYVSATENSSAKENLKIAQTNFQKLSDEFDLLPPGVEGVHQKAYHLYPPAYAAIKMKKQFPDNNMAQFLPVILNNRYEMLTDDNGSYEALPASIQQFTPSSQNDMYLAIQGYRVFINKAKPESFQNFLSKPDFKKYIESLINHK